MHSKTINPGSSPPPGLFLLQNKPFKHHQILVLTLTYISYTSFHASRKPPSIIKSILSTTWAPFTSPQTGPHRLGELDLSFLLSYAVGMFFSGHIADSFDLRVFLVCGMIGSGLSVILFGACFFLKVHSFLVFVVVQIVCGVFQSVGWPCVVAVVGNWLGKGNRGLVMGVWSSHGSLGNVLGSIVASSVLVYGWGWSFVVVGVFVLVVAVFVYFFLVVSPEVVGFEMVEEREVEMGEVENVALVESRKDVEEEEGIEEGKVAIGFLEAWRLPHVASYAFCLFFSKLVAYTFLYWLPFYIKNTGDCCLFLIPFVKIL